MKLACPNCGANILYVLGTNEVKCEHCNQKTLISNINISDYINYSKSLKEDLKEVDTNSITISEKMKDSSNCKLNNNQMLMCKKCHSSFIVFNSNYISSCPYCYSKWSKNGINGNLSDLTISKYISFSQNIIDKKIELFDNSDTFGMAYTKTYLPFLASCDKINYDSTRINCQEEMLTLQYIGKSFDYNEIQSIINFDLSKLENFTEDKIESRVVIDAANDELSDLKKRHKQNIKISLKKQLCTQLKDINYQINEDKDTIQCTSIKNEIILLPFYIRKENELVYIINGQNGEKNVFGTTKTNTTASRLILGSFLTPFMIFFLFLAICFLFLVFEILKYLFTFKLDEMSSLLVVAIFEVLFLLPFKSIISLYINDIIKGDRIVKTKYKKELPTFDAIVWNKNIKIKGSDKNE